MTANRGLPGAPHALVHRIGAKSRLVTHCRPTCVATCGSVVSRAGRMSTIVQLTIRGVIDGRCVCGTELPHHAVPLYASLPRRQCRTNMRYAPCVAAVAPCQISSRFLHATSPKPTLPLCSECPQRCSPRRQCRLRSRTMSHTRYGAVVRARYCWCTGDVRCKCGLPTNTTHARHMHPNLCSPSLAICVAHRARIAKLRLGASGTCSVFMSFTVIES